MGEQGIAPAPLNNPLSSTHYPSLPTSAVLSTPVMYLSIFSIKIRSTPVQLHAGSVTTDATGPFIFAMASLLARGIRRSVWSLQRQPVAPLARAGCRHRQAAPAALVTRPSTASHDQKQFFHGTRACTEEGKESSTVSGVPRELDEFKDFCACFVFCFPLGYDY